MSNEKDKFIVEYLNKKLTGEQIKNFIEFLTVGEEGLAYEILCEQIYEKDIKISKRILEILKHKCISYGVDLDYLKDIEHLIID
ncbi:MAG: MafI family immunity protein [bacterium]